MKPMSFCHLPHLRAADLASTLVAVSLVISGMGLQGADAPRDEDLPLPKWTEEELRAFRESGNTVPMLDPLLPDVPGYMERAEDLLRAGPRLDELPSELSAEITPRLRVEDLRLFLSAPAITITSEPRTASPALREVPPEFLQAASETLRTEYLIDPDVLVPEMHHLQMLRFLEFHARDARIKLYVLILPPEGILPPSPPLERLASGNLVKSESCLLAYPLGHPERARLFVSKSVFDLTSAEFLAETAEACERAANQQHDPHDQLQNYGIELSKRLFWLQKALNLGTQAASEHPDTLTEFAKSGAGKDALPAVAASSDQEHDSTLLAVMWSLAGILSVTCAYIAGAHIARWRKRKTQGCVWMLPEVEPLSRLGGAFTGGGGGIIR